MTFAGKPITIFKHRECLGDIITSSTAGAFKYNRYLFNPTNPALFPWLHQIAVNYESYRVRGCIFEFRSMSGNALNSVNTALGNVIMSF